MKVWVGSGEGWVGVGWARGSRWSRSRSSRPTHSSATGRPRWPGRPARTPAVLSGWNMHAGDAACSKTRLQVQAAVHETAACLVSSAEQKACGRYTEMLAHVS